MQHTNQQKQTTPLQELELESRLGSVGIESNRKVPVIDLSNFKERKAEISDQLWSAATEFGFFQLSNHGIATPVIEDAFAMSEKFFALPETVKSKYPLKNATNSGWESMAQVRPSTKTADQKESYQITRPRMAELYPVDELPEFINTMLGFESQCWQVGMRVLSCFADKLGFDSQFFSQAHDPGTDDYQSTLRLLHYYALNGEQEIDENCWRAGAHTDFDCLTLLFQRTGQDGLQLCPGKEALSNEWTSIYSSTDLITCNIGDMLMRWSDDQLKSTLHRVKMPGPDDYRGPRYTLGFFCQANQDVMIESPAGKYEPITAADYLKLRLNANFGKKY